MRRSKCRILCSLLLCCLFLFSGSLTVFADDSDSYNIECVPYSQYISNLVVVDNETQVIMRSARAQSGASSSADDYLYNWTGFYDVYYGVRNSGWSPGYMIYSSTAGANIVNPYYTKKSNATIQINGASDNHPDTTFSLAVPLLKVGNKYRFSFTIKQPNQVYGVLTFCLVDSANGANKINLCSFGNASSVFARCDTTVSGDVIIPDTWSGTPKLVLKLASWTSFQSDYINKPPVITLSNISFADVTNENLDNSLGKLGDRISGFFDNLVESIKGFFIPKEGFFETAKEQFDQLLSDHLGFLYEAPSMVVDIFEVIGDWDPPEQPSITLPAFNFNIADHPVHLWDEQVYTFDFLGEQPWSTLYAIYKTFVFVLLSVAMINLAIKKYHDIVGGGSSDDN